MDFYSDRYVGTNLDNPSFAEISRAMGGEGVTVTRPEQALILFRAHLLLLLNFPNLRLKLS